MAGLSSLLQGSQGLSREEKAILPEHLWYLLEKMKLGLQKEDTGRGLGGGFNWPQLPSFQLPSIDLGLQGPSVELPQPTIELPQPTVELPQPTVALPQPTIGLPQPSVGLPQLSLPSLPSLPTPQLPSFQPPQAGLPSLPSIGVPELDLSKLGLPSLPELNLPQLTIPGLPEEIRKILEIAYPGFKQDESGKIIFNPDTGETIDITKALGNLSGQDWLSKLGSTAGDIYKAISTPIETGLGAVGLGSLTQLISPVSAMLGGTNLIANLLNVTGYNKTRAIWEAEQNEAWNKTNKTATKNYMYETPETGQYYRLGAQLVVGADPGVKNMPNYAPSGWVQVNPLPGNQGQSYYRPIERYNPVNNQWINWTYSLLSKEKDPNKYKTFTLKDFTSGDIFA